MSTTGNDNWHDVLFKWFEKWLQTYKNTVIDAYNILNRELIPTRQYERALVWCLHMFDVTVLTHQMVSLVRETEGQEIYSVYRMPIDGLVDVLKRLENQMIQCRNTFDELLTLNAIERMYAASVSLTTPGFEPQPLFKGDAAVSAADITALPTGVISYEPGKRYADLMTDLMESAVQDQQLADMAATLELLRAGSDRDAVHAENLNERLPPNEVRAIFTVVAPGDSELARTVVESYLAKLKETVEGVKTYRLDYGGLLSKWRGESEKNFETLMQWMVERARQNAQDGQGFDALWMDNVHVLMGQRGGSSGGGGDGGGGAEDFLTVIKTTMLQIMDIFNKDKRLSRFALIFSTGAQQMDVDSAFRRRMDGIYELPSLSQSPVLRDLIIRHALRITGLNVEGDALARLNAVKNASELQSTVYLYYVRARFIIGTEFYIAEPGTQNYFLQPLKAYYSLDGNVVRTGSPGCPILQAVKHVIAVTGVDKPQRRFYRPGEIDPRNLPKHLANSTVFVLSDFEDG